MANTTTFSEFSVLSSQIFENILQTPGREFYFFIGRSEAWPAETVQPLTDSRQSQVEIWRNMLAVKKVLGSDITNAFKQIDWTSGQVYDEYRHNYSDDNPAASGAIRIRDARTYVVNSANQVFRCIYNNKDGASTSEPSVFSPDTTAIFETADGYRWKYLFTLNGSSLNKFNSPKYYPFTEENLAVKAAAVPGGIHNIRVINGGSGFPTNTTIPLFVDGDGAKLKSAAGTITRGAGGSIASVSVASGGSGVWYPSSTTIPVNLLQPTSNGPVNSAYGLATTNAEGKVTAVSVIKPGESYVDGIPVSIVASSCVPFANTNELGKIESITIYNGMEGLFFNTATVTVVSPAGSGESLEPIISPVGGHGAFQEFDVNAFNVLLNVRLSSSDTEIPTGNDFRSFGIVTGLAKLVGGSPVPFTDASGSVIPILNVTSAVASTFIEDERVYGSTSGASATIVSITRNVSNFATSFSVVRGDSDNSYDFVAGEALVSESGAVATLNTITPSDIISGYGAIIYGENRTPVSRNTNQSESITIVIEL